MRTIETQAFQYSELSDAAKQVARDWYKGIACTDSDWFESVYSDAVEVAKIIGIEMDTKRGARNTPAIYFSGFCSQGDGACFEASYHYVKGATKAIAAYAPQDKELQRIAKELQDIQRRNFYRLVAATSHSGHYYHSGCMRVSVEDRENQYRDVDIAEHDITQALRDFADWIFKQLQLEYDYQTSDENAEEMIIANEYEFDENGNRI